MTTSTDYPFRSGQLRRAGVLMKLPRVVIAAVVWLLAIEALPGPAAWGVLAVVAVGTVAGVVAESVVVRLVWWARRPATPLAVSGDSGVLIWVTGRQAAGIGQAGRRHLIVPATWIGRTDLPELLTRARQRQLVTGGRFDVAYQWFTWPWQLLAALVAGFAHGMTRLPLIGFAWRMRLAVVGIALWQTVVASQVTHQPDLPARHREETGHVAPHLAHLGSTRARMAVIAASVRRVRSECRHAAATHRLREAPGVKVRRKAHPSPRRGSRQAVPAHPHGR